MEGRAAPRRAARHGPEASLPGQGQGKGRRGENSDRGQDRQRGPTSGAGIFARTEQRRDAGSPPCRGEPQDPMQSGNMPGPMARNVPIGNASGPGRGSQPKCGEGRAGDDVAMVSARQSDALLAGRPTGILGEPRKPAACASSSFSAVRSRVSQGSSAGPDQPPARLPGSNRAFPSRAAAAPGPSRRRACTAVEGDAPASEAREHHVAVFAAGLRTAAPSSGCRRRGSVPPRPDRARSRAGREAGRAPPLVPRTTPGPATTSGIPIDICVRHELLPQAAIAQHLAMVAGEDDHRVVRAGRSRRAP